MDTITLHTSSGGAWLGLKAHRCSEISYTYLGGTCLANYLHVPMEVPTDKPSTRGYHLQGSRSLRYP